jgi:hypothetical protein
MSAARNNSAANAVNMNALLREINSARRANRNMNPRALNPAAPAWNPPLNPAAQPFYPAGMNPAAAPFVPAEVPDAQAMNAYLREINTTRRANMPNQRRRKTRKNRKSRKSRKASRRS